jgi:hypothetical protein
MLHTPASETLRIDGSRANWHLIILTSVVIVSDGAWRTTRDVAVEMVTAS